MKQKLGKGDILTLIYGLIWFGGGLIFLETHGSLVSVYYLFGGLVIGILLLKIWVYTADLV